MVMRMLSASIVSSFASCAPRHRVYWVSGETPVHVPFRRG